MTKSNKLLITGINGFVGGSFIDFLNGIPKNQIPSEIMVVSRQKISDELNKNLKKLNIPVKSEIYDLTKPWNFTFKVNWILNFAADGGINSYSDSAGRDYIRIIENMVTWAKRKEVINIFQTSSGACSYATRISNEQNRSSTKSVFIKYRVEAEQILLEAIEKKDINVIIARLYSFIGPRILSKSQYAISQFMDEALNRKIIKITGNPNTLRSYLSTNDMSRWIYKSLGTNNSKEILHIGSSHPVSILELASYIALKTNSKVEIMNENAPLDDYFANNATTLNMLRESETSNWCEMIDSLLSILRKGK